jgi:hypothetical protein
VEITVGYLKALLHKDLYILNHLFCFVLRYQVTDSMADGVLTLANFAFDSSITLFQLVHSFKSHPARVRHLKEELEALSKVLNSLTETIKATPNLDVSALDLPLKRCGDACKEFEQELLKCSKRSGGDQKSFRDWAKLKYMGGDIDDFTQSLAGYKSTIIIALTDVSL